MAARYYGSVLTAIEEAERRSARIKELAAKSAFPTNEEALENVRRAMLQRKRLAPRQGRLF